MAWLHSRQKLSPEKILGSRDLWLRDAKVKTAHTNTTSVLNVSLQTESVHSLAGLQMARKELPSTTETSHN